VDKPINETYYYSAESDDDMPMGDFVVPNNELDD
jgi:hypothetical protein